MHQARTVLGKSRVICAASNDDVCYTGFVLVTEEALGSGALNSNPTLRPGSSLAEPNGPVRHSSPCDPNTGYWDRFSQS